MTGRFENQIITILGGTGFVGRSIIARLAAEGARIKVVTRNTSSAYIARALGAPGQITAVPCNYHSKTSLETALKGSDAVINCTGILFEKGKNARFTQVHKILPGWIGEIAKAHNIPRIIHISALGVETSKSRYGISKHDGETALKKSCSAATILRPSVIFGQDDDFINNFARLAAFLPALPLIGGGKTKFQPVYVEDVACAVTACLANPNTRGQTYNCAGSDILSFADILRMILQTTHQKCCLLPTPWWVARLQALAFQTAFAVGLTPKPLLTNDQITSLQTDAIADTSYPGLSDLGIKPTPLAAIIPTYLVKAQ